jgi:hypothetical protein
MPVEMASAIDVKFVAPKALLVRYTEKTKVVMTVLNGCAPQSHIPQAMTRRRDESVLPSSAVGPVRSAGSEIVATVVDGIDSRVSVAAADRFRPDVSVVDVSAHAPGPRAPADVTTKLPHR